MLWKMYSQFTFYHFACHFTQSGYTWNFQGLRFRQKKKTVTKIALFTSSQLVGLFWSYTKLPNPCIHLEYSKSQLFSFVFKYVLIFTITEFHNSLFLCAFFFLSPSSSVESENQNRICIAIEPAQLLKGDVMVS